MKQPSRKLLRIMRREHDAGLSYRLIGLKRGWTKGSVEYWLKRKGTKGDMPKLSKELEDRNERIVTAVMRGIQLKRVAHIIGCSYQVVWKVASKHGVKPVTAVRRERARAWAKRHDAGESIATISDAENVPRSTVWMAIDRLRNPERFAGPTPEGGPRWVTFLWSTTPFRETKAAHLEHPERRGYSMCNLTVGGELKAAKCDERKCEKCVRRYREIRRGRFKQEAA